MNNCIKDMTGQRFGKLTVLSFIERKNSKTYWLCQCDCGNTTIAQQGNLHQGGKASCGCLVGQANLGNTRRRVDFSGQRFGRLLVLSFSHVEKNKSFSNVRCDCGNEFVTSNNRMQNGSTRSCGCLLFKPGAAQRELYGKYKQRARRAELAFELDYAAFIEFVQQDCFYCGVPPLQIIESFGAYEKFKYNGIDRWDNDLGYIWSNIVPCCGTCNKQKHTQSGEEYLTRCQLIAARAQEILAKRNPVKENQTCAF